MSKSFVKRSLSVVLLFAALLCVSAPALAYPKWVGVKGKWSIVRNESQKDPNAKDYKKIKVSVTYTNNSRDKIITAIFNKTLSMEGGLKVKWDGGGRYGAEPIKASIKSTRVSKMELYPGQSTSMYYLLPVNGTSHLRDFNKYGADLGINKWWHDFQVSSKGI
ncbi:MAG: hypothetical protein IJR68_08055 [Fretibacterium sp.]|nr:hypothetical protein [Fretibacterium sp.]